MATQTYNTAEPGQTRVFITRMFDAPRSSFLGTQQIRAYIPWLPTGNPNDSGENLNRETVDHIDIFTKIMTAMSMHFMESIMRSWPLRELSAHLNLKDFRKKGM